jgi:antitoxin CptB
MTGSQISSAGLDARRRRLLFRSWRRGMREMDLVLGRFADAQIGTLTDAELDEYERLLEIPDQQMFAWVCGTETVPADIDTALLRRVLASHRNGPTSA